MSASRKFKEFRFYGKADNLAEIITAGAAEQKKDIIVYCDEPGKIQIGFQRLGHSGGRFFTAEIMKDGEETILRGKPTDIYPGQKQGKIRNFLRNIGEWLAVYVFLELLPFGIWLCFGDIKFLFIPLVIPLLILAVLIPRNKREQDKTDDKFYSFLTGVLEGPSASKARKNTD